ncbi:cupredoxin domain-containing protein [Rhizobium sp. PAMB 3182]
MKERMTIAVAAIAILAGTAFSAATAADVKTYEITLSSESFSPQQISAKAGEPFRIKLHNKTELPVELESGALGFEKIVESGHDIVVNVRAQEPGTYDFFDDFHPKQYVGHVVVE